MTTMVMDDEVQDFHSVPATRCDKCAAQALSTARKGDYELMFCLHHTKQYYDALVLDGWNIIHDFESIEMLTRNTYVEVGE